jgi:hypothetical protein
MAETLYEEACRCPTCNEPGKLINVRTARVPATVATPGTKVHLLECRNDRCPDFVPPELAGSSTLIPGERGRWYVQVNPDGTVPPKGSGSTGPKAFESESVHSALAQRARDNLRYLAAKDERKGEAYEIGRDLGYPD